MHRLQLLLNLSDRFYEAWLSGPGFQSFRRILNRFPEAWDGVDSRYWMVLPEHPNLEEPDRYVRAALYLPLMPEFHQFRQSIGIGNGSELKLETVQFRIKTPDVPEYLHWHRCVLILKRLYQMDSQLGAVSVYPQFTIGSDSGLEGFRRFLLETTAPSAGEYLRRHPELKWGECNSRFALNLFLYTRDPAVWQETMDYITESSYQTVHNSLVAVARVHGWRNLVRRILDGNPEVTQPFALFA